MRTIEKAANDYALSREDNDYIIETEMAFTAGVKFAQAWIDVNKQLPDKGVEVLVKVEKLSWITTNHAVAYLLKNTDDVWIIEGKRCSHYKNAENNCVTHWRPIERL